MDLTEFVFGIFNGIAGNAAYDQIKNILGNKISPKLEDASNKGDKEKFLTILESVMDANEEMRLKIENLQKGKSTTINQMNNIYGDNVAGNKVINTK